MQGPSAAANYKDWQYKAYSHQSDIVKCIANCPGNNKGIPGILLGSEENQDFF